MSCDLCSTESVHEQDRRPCNGECPKNRVIRTLDGEPGLNYLCSGLQKYWHHADKPIED